MMKPGSDIMQKILRKNNLNYLIIGIILLSAFLYFFYNNQTMEKDIKGVLTKEQIKQIGTSTTAISYGVNLDLDQINDKLYLLSHYDGIRNNLFSTESYDQLKNAFDKIDAQTPVVSLFIMDKDFTTIEVRHDDLALTGFRMSEKMNYFEQVKKTLKPVFLTEFRDLEGSYQITILQPILDKDDKSLKGIIGIALPTADFFAHHGNIVDVSAQHMIIYDKQGVIVATPQKEFLGKSYADPAVEEFYKNDVTRDLHVKKVLSGTAGHAIYATKNDEVIDFGYPIRINQVNEYFLFLITPTKAVYQQTDSILETQRIQMIIVMVSIVVTSFVFLIKHARDLKKEAEIKRRQDAELQEIKIKTEKLTVIGTLASRLAHDLRNPLNIIKQTIALYEYKNIKYMDDLTRNQFKRINRAIERMSNQTNTVLDFVRVKPLEISEESILPILQKIVDNYEDMDEIAIILPLNDVKLCCDSKKLEIVFENLVRNAVEAMNGRGVITIRVSQHENNAIIQVEDDGPSIPDENMIHIFEPMFTTKQTGTGLGLVSCKTIVEQHGGTIVAQNHPTVFTITLPTIQIHTLKVDTNT